MRNRRVRCLSARYPSPCLLRPPHSSFTLCLCPSHFLRFSLETSSAALQVDDNMERENNNNIIHNKERRRNRRVQEGVGEGRRQEARRGVYERGRGIERGQWEVGKKMGRRK